MLPFDTLKVPSPNFTIKAQCEIKSCDNPGTQKLTKVFLFYPCKGLTESETTYVAPEGLEPYEVSCSLSVYYTCKFNKGDVKVNDPRFASISVVLRTVSKIISFYFMQKS
jgi:hypothetical protein